MSEKVYAIEIEAPIQRVWDEITSHGEVNRAMYGCVLESAFKPGQTYRYTNKKDSHTMVMGEVVEIDPPKKLVHTFLFTWYDDAPSLVTWKLSEQAGVTKVVVTHQSLVDGTKTNKDIQGGWPTILKLYKQVIETGSAGLKTNITQGMMGAMSFMLPAQTKTANAKSRKVSMP